MQPPEQFVLRQLKYHPLPAGDRFQGLYLEGLGHIYSIIIYVSTIFRYFMLFQLFFLQDQNLTLLVFLSTLSPLCLIFDMI